MDLHLNFYPSVEKKANNICNITTKTKFIVDNINVALFDNTIEISFSLDSFLLYPSKSS